MEKTPTPADGKPGISKTTGLIFGLAVLLAAAAGFYASGIGRTAASFGALTRYVFVQSLDAPEITLIDVVEDKVAGAITLPVHPDLMMISNPLERMIFTNHEAKQVLMYDLATQTVDFTLDLEFNPENAVLSPDGFTLVVADSVAGKVGVINLAEKYLVSTIDDLNRPANIAFSNSSEYVFISDSTDGEIEVINVISGKQIDPIKLSLKTPAEDDPEGTALSAVTRTPNGLYGMTVGRDSGQMSVIGFSGWQEATTLPVGANPTRPYGTADGQFVMVASNDDRTITVMSTEYFDKEATLPGVSDVTSIATGYFETLAFVVSGEEQKAVIVDLTDMSVAGEIVFGGTPGPAVVDADGKKMYVALTDTNELVVVDVFSKAILTTISDVGHSPWGVTLAVTNNYCH